MITTLNNLDILDKVSIEQVKFESKDRPAVTNKIRKGLFFLRREGPLRTYKKIKSKTTDALIAHRYLTTIVLEHNGKTYYNHSTQTTQNPEHFVVSTYWTLFKKETTNVTGFNQYTQIDTEESGIELTEKRQLTTDVATTSNSGLFIYGLGDYSRVYVGAHIKKVNKIACIDYHHSLSQFYKEKFGFKHALQVPQDSYALLKTVENPICIIATYHSDHAHIASEIFKHNKNALIFIEKPPTVTLDDISILTQLYNQKAQIKIGYNRRHIKANKKIKSLINKHAAIINISVKEILINESHWYFWENQGTRITGNLTHWIDLAVYWVKATPIEISLLVGDKKDETIGVQIAFEDGSLVCLSVSDRGNSLRGVQELVQVRCNGQTVLIEDYTRIITYNKEGSKKTNKPFFRVKGHDAMYKDLFSNYKNKYVQDYPLEDLILTTWLTWKISDMFINGENYAFIKDDINMLFNL